MVSMREILKASGRWVKAGWLLPLVLLALPNCVLDVSGIDAGRPHAFDPGPEPKTSAIMCQIPKAESIQSVQCATDQEVLDGISLTEAAVALATGEKNPIGLDYSPASLITCGGKPRKIVFQGTFPDGYAACLNCGSQIPAVYANSNDVCIAQCEDLINFGNDAFDYEQGTVETFCAANAKVATNFDKSACFDNACSDGGTLLPNFEDPRRIPEDVVWKDLIGTTDLGTSLKRTAVETGPNASDYNAGAASGQFIESGDGWVEFAAAETDLGHVLGLSMQCLGCVDSDPSLNDVHFGFALNLDGNAYVIESGNFVPGPGINGSHGAYVVGEKYRVAFTDTHDGKASISYYRVNGPCSPGTQCNTTLLAAHPGGATYPLRVDATFRQQNATVTNVTLVRIQ
jgi:hypothetical protein